MPTVRFWSKRANRLPLSSRRKSSRGASIKTRGVRGKVNPIDAEQHRLRHRMAAAIGRKHKTFPCPLVVVIVVTESAADEGKERPSKKAPAETI